MSLHWWKKEKQPESSLIWKIPSDGDRSKEYDVELDSFGGNGECSCDAFRFDLRPLLARNVRAFEAFSKNMIELKPGEEYQDILRCKHIKRARRQLADATISAFAAAKAAHGTLPGDAPR